MTLQKYRKDTQGIGQTVYLLLDDLAKHTSDTDVVYYRFLFLG